MTTAPELQRPLYAPRPGDPGWSDNVEARLDVGDAVRGSVEMIVQRPPDVRAWLDGVTRDELTRIWNSSLERDGSSTRVEVLHFEVAEGFLTGSPDTFGVRFVVVGVVIHNLPILAYAAVALLVAILAGIYVNGQRVVSASGRATGTFLGAAAEGFIDAAPKFSLVAAALIFLGVYLWAD